MNDRFHTTRRSFTGGLLGLGLTGTHALAQGFAGLGRDAEGFATVMPGRVLTFPADHGAHPEYRIEWWYLTANLTDAHGAAYGLQWTLFRQAMNASKQENGWANQQIWMGHVAVTNAATHRFGEAFARGGVGQAGVTAQPFSAWIDAWEMHGGETISATTLSPMTVKASGNNFSYRLQLDADRPLVLQGDGGYSRKSDRGQASYYYSQPWFKASGTITIDDKPVEVSGQAWMDREWSSQPLASDQTGWDWFSLHLQSGVKLMLFRLRQKGGDNYFSGNWITPDGKSEQIVSSAMTMTPTAFSTVAGRKLPTSWQVHIPARGLTIDTLPVNAQSWMGTSYSYWEGPISFTGSHGGVGYLEMTGY